VPSKGELIYGTCVALGKSAAILMGPSGSGKSDLALRFLLHTPQKLDPMLVSDDQVRVIEREGRIIAAPPETIAGKIEVRGVGIVDMPYLHEADVRLLVELLPPEKIPRLPPSPLPLRMICGLGLPVFSLAPFEASAHSKLCLVLQANVQ
jgi:serine kinase of HPr protein (carbohydrate metabolism regulator)